MKKIFLTIMLFLLLAGIPLCVIEIRTVRADETICINADGSIDPPTAPISTVDNVTYTLTDDIINGSIVVQRDNVVLDGKGHSLQMFNTYNPAVYLYMRKNVTLTRVVIWGFDTGISLDSSHRNRIINNTLVASETCGISLYQSNYNFITDNEIMNASGAISLESSNNNVLTGNTVHDNVEGISLYLGKNNTLRNNLMYHNMYSFYVGMYYLDSYLNDVDTSNLVDGRPIYYWINHNNETVPEEAGCVVIVNSSKVTVKNLVLRNGICAVTFALTTNSLIEDVVATENEVAINLDHSDFNTITNNNITFSTSAGIGLNLADYNTISYNTVVNTTGSAIWLEDTSGNVVSGNSVSNTTQGYGVQEYNAAGVLVDDSNLCQITNNSLVRNTYGIVLGAFASEFNDVIGNSMVASHIGLVLFEGGQNTVYHNNFIQSDLTHVYTCWGTQDCFDNGYPSGGNYWSGYMDNDSYSGPHQDKIGSDGIGDSPHVIDASNQDNYPLTKPYGGPVDVGITNVNLPKTVVGQGFNINVSVKVLNYGEQTETFNVTVEANSTALETQTVTSESRTSQILNYTFNTGSFAEGNYAINAYASILEGELDTVNNNFTGGNIAVTFVGDANGDGKVRIDDVLAVALRFGTDYGGPPNSNGWGYDGNCDINGDDRIRIDDVLAAAQNFGLGH